LPLDMFTLLAFIQLLRLTPLRPPVPTLFPYTMLFRSLGHRELRRAQDHRLDPRPRFGDGRPGAGGRRFARVLPGAPDEPYRQGGSEEHTSELRSRLELVCRLLLAKKTALILTLLQTDK